MRKPLLGNVRGNKIKLLAELEEFDKGEYIDLKTFTYDYRKDELNNNSDKTYKAQLIIWSDEDEVLYADRTEHKAEHTSMGSSEGEYQGMHGRYFYIATDGKTADDTNSSGTIYIKDSNDTLIYRTIVLPYLGQDDYKHMLNDLVDIYRDLVVSENGSVSSMAEVGDKSTDGGKVPDRQVQKLIRAADRIIQKPEESLNQEYEKIPIRKVKHLSSKTIQEWKIQGKQKVHAGVKKKTIDIYENKILKKALKEQVSTLSSKIHNDQESLNENVKEKGKDVFAEAENFVKNNSYLAYRASNEKSVTLDFEWKGFPELYFDEIKTEKDNYYNIDFGLLKDVCSPHLRKPESILQSTGIQKEDYVKCDVKLQGRELLLFLYCFIKLQDYYEYWTKKPNYGSQYTRFVITGVATKETEDEAVYGYLGNPVCYTIKHVDKIAIITPANRRMIELKLADFKYECLLKQKEIMRLAFYLNVQITFFLDSEFSQKKHFNYIDYGAQFKKYAKYKRDTHLSDSISTNQRNLETIKKLLSADVLTNVSNTNEKVHLTNLFMKNRNYRDAYEAITILSPQLNIIDYTGERQFPVGKLVDIYEVWCYFRLIKIFVEEYRFEIVSINGNNRNKNISDFLKKYLDAGYSRTLAKDGLDIELCRNINQQENKIILSYNRDIQVKQNRRLKGGSLRPDIKLLINDKYIVYMDAKCKDYSNAEYYKDMFGVAAMKYIFAIQSGEISKNEELAGEKRIIGSFILHPDYRNNYFGYDVANTYMQLSDELKDEISEYGNIDFGTVEKKTAVEYFMNNLRDYRIGSIRMKPKDEGIKSLIALIMEHLLANYEKAAVDAANRDNIIENIHKTRFRSICWKCGSDDIWVDDGTTERGYSKYHVNCHNCGETWVQTHCNNKHCNAEFIKRRNGYLKDTGKSSINIICPICRGELPEQDTIEENK